MKKMLLLVLVLCGLGYGATKTWNAASDNATWATSGNWSPSGAPAAADSVVFNGTSTKTCVIGANTNAIGALIVTSAYTGTIDCGNYRLLITPTSSSSFNISGSQIFKSGTGYVQLNSGLASVNLPATNVNTCELVIQNTRSAGGNVLSGGTLTAGQIDFTSYYNGTSSAYRDINNNNIVCSGSINIQNFYGAGATANDSIDWRSGTISGTRFFTLNNGGNLNIKSNMGSAKFRISGSWNYEAKYTVYEGTSSVTFLGTADTITSKGNKFYDIIDSVNTGGTLILADSLQCHYLKILTSTFNANSKSIYISGVKAKYPAPTTLSCDKVVAYTGDTISIIGLGFGITKGTNHMEIGAASVITFPIWSDWKINAIIPSGLSGTQKIYITNGSGVDSSLSITSDSTFQRKITISNTSGGALKNYQVKVNLTSSNYNWTIGANKNRIYFRNNSGIIKHHVETWDTANKIGAIWVNSPSIASGTDTVSMIYGRAAASVDTSHPNQTFNFWDDFKSNNGYQGITNISSPRLANTYPITILSSVNKTYIGFVSVDYQHYWSVYNKNSKTVEGTYNVNSTVTANDPGHNFVTGTMDTNKFLYSFSGRHNDTLYVRVSSQADSATNWGASTYIYKYATYPTPLADSSNNVYCFFRKGNASTMHVNFTMAKTGNKFSSFTLTDVLACDSSNTYPTYFYVPYFDKKHNRIWIAWLSPYVNDPANDTLTKYLYTAYSDDGGATWKNKNGGTYTLPINSFTPNPSLALWTDKTMWPISVSGDTNGNPVILTYKKTNGWYDWHGKLKFTYRDSLGNWNVSYLNDSLVPGNAYSGITVDNRNNCVIVTPHYDTASNTFQLWKYLSPDYTRWTLDKKITNNYSTNYVTSNVKTDFRFDPVLEYATGSTNGRLTLVRNDTIITSTSTGIKGDTLWSVVDSTLANTHISIDTTNGRLIANCNGGAKDQRANAFVGNNFFGRGLWGLNFKLNTYAGVQYAHTLIGLSSGNAEWVNLMTDTAQNIPYGFNKYTRLPVFNQFSGIAINIQMPAGKTYPYFYLNTSYQQTNTNSTSDSIANSDNTRWFTLKRKSTDSAYYAIYSDSTRATLATSKTIAINPAIDSLFNLQIGNYQYTNPERYTNSTVQNIYMYKVANPEPTNSVATVDSPYVTISTVNYITPFNLRAGSNSLTISGLSFGVVAGNVKIDTSHLGTPSVWVDTSIVVPVPTSALHGIGSKIIVQNATSGLDTFNTNVRIINPTITDTNSFTSIAYTYPVIIKWKTQDFYTDAFYQWLYAYRYSDWLNWDSETDSIKAFIAVVYNATTALAAGYSVKIEISRDSLSTWSTIASGLTNSGSYVWTATSPTTTKAYVRLSATEDATINGLGNKFAIIYPGPTITSQPTNQTASDYSTATFACAATSSGGTLHHQWRLLTGGNWGDIAGQTTGTLSFQALYSMNGNQYKDSLWDDNGTINSNTVTLTVTKVTPTINTQPQSTSVNDFATATFTVTATSSLVPINYQWQNDSSGSYVNIAGATNSSLSFTSKYLQNGVRYKVLVSNVSDNVLSDAATLTVSAIAPAISSQPANTTKKPGTTATFAVTAYGTGTLTYQWQLSTNSGSTFANISSATSTSYTTGTLALSDSGRQYRVRITNTTGSTNSSAAILSVTTKIPASNKGTVSSAYKPEYIITYKPAFTKAYK